MSAMWTPKLIRTPARWPRSLPTKTRANSVAALIKRLCWEKKGLASAAPTATDEASALLPGVSDLIESLGAEALGRAGDRAAAERAIKLHRRLVVGQRP